MPPHKMFRVCTLFCFVLGLAGCSRQHDHGHGRDSRILSPGIDVKTNDSSQSTRPPAKKSHHSVTFYTVDHYDESRDPAKDLAEAVQIAVKEKKRILVQVGGDWCYWCRLMSNFMETNDVVRNTITQHFLVMKVTFTDKQKNETFLSQFPEIAGYPHIFVLDSDGTFLHSQGTAELEEGKGYNEAVYLKFLRAWQPVR